MAVPAGSSGRWKVVAMAAALLSVSLVAFAADAELASVTAIRYSSLTDVTRITIETTAPVVFRTDKLSQPDRFFFDIKDTKPKLDSKGVFFVVVKDPRVRQVRVAKTQPTVTRVVLDLELDCDVTATQVSAPDRLLVEVRPKGSASAPLVTSNFDTRPVATPSYAAAKATPVRTNEPPVLTSKPAPITTPVPGSELRLPPPPEKPSTAKAVTEVTETSAKPARRNTSGDRSMTRALGLKLRRVVIDPGHGGHDHGTTGPNGLTEKELVLDVSRRLGSLIEEGLGSEVVYTRNSDKYIGLEERPAFANEKKADLFLSIHANSSPIRTASGAETYVLSFATSRAALDVAARENASSQKSISDLKELLQKIAFKEKVDESREFAAKVQDALTKLTLTTNPPKPGVRRDRGVKRAPFVVLIGAQMPSILCEIGFVTNSKEEALLQKGDYRQKLAEAIYKGVQQYADTLSQFEVAQTQKRDGSE